MRLSDLLCSGVVLVSLKPCVSQGILTVHQVSSYMVIPTRHREKGEILHQISIFPPPTSLVESDIHLLLVSNPTANLLSDETQAYGLSMNQAINVLEMQHGLEDDLYIIPQRSMSKMFNVFLLLSSPVISRKCFYLHCPTKHGRTSLYSAKYLVICQKKNYLYLEYYL